MTSCGNSSDEAATPSEDTQKLVETEVQEAQATGGFDTEIVVPTGESYILSSPTKFTPGKFAAGQIVGQSFNRFEVTVKNGTNADLDLAALIVQGSTASGACVDIFDGDAAIDGAPLDPLPVGQSKSFGWALSCPGKGGEDLTVKLLNGETALIEAKGKLS